MTGQAIIRALSKAGFVVVRRKSPDGERVKWQYVLNAYDYLRKHGEATNRTPDGKVNKNAFGYRGAFIMPLLAELTTVATVERKIPRTARYFPQGYPPRLRREVQPSPKRRLTVLIERDDEGWYVASVPELRGCHTQGETLDEVVENIKDAARLCLEVEQEKGNEEVKLELGNKARYTGRDAFPV